MKKLVKTHLFVGSMLSMLLTTQVKPMQRALQSPAGRTLLAKRIALANLKKAKSLKQPVWLRTKEGQLIALDLWQINEMSSLKTLLDNQQQPNSQDNPIDVADLTISDLELLVTAFNKIATGQFERYYAELQPEYQKSLTNKAVGEGTLRILISLAGKTKAKTLSAFLASYFLPNDIQKYLMVPQIIDPVVTYLKEEILKNNKLHPSILAGHEGPVTNCVLSKNGQVAVTGATGKQNNLIVWNAQTGQRLQTLSIKDGDVKYLGVNQDGSKFFAQVKKHFQMQKFFEGNDIQSAESQNIICLWDGTNGKLIKTIQELPGTFISNIEFGGNGQTIIMGIDNDKEITDTTAPEEKTNIMIISGVDGSTIAHHEVKNNYSSFTLNPQGNTFVARSGTDLILYDALTGKQITVLDGPVSPIYDVQYSAHGSQIMAYDTQAQAIFIWDAKTGVQQARFDGIASSINAISPDGTKLATIDNGTISIWNIAQHTQLITINKNPLHISQAIFNSDNNTIAIYDSANNITIFNSISGEQLQSFYNENPQSSGLDLAFNTTGTRIKSYSSSPENEKKCTVNLWETSTGKQIHSFVEKHEFFSINEDFTTAICRSDKNNRNFILWKSFDTQEESTLGAIENNLTIAQAQTLYQLYIAKLNNAYTSLSDSEQYKKLLPPDVQKMVTRYLHITAPKIKMGSLKTLPTASAQPIDIPSIPAQLNETVQPRNVPAKEQTWSNWFNSWYK